MGDKDQRIDRILSLLKHRAGIGIRDLAAELEVSEMTVRRDLRSLAADGTVTLLHGAAVLNQATYYRNYEQPYLLTTEGSKNLDAKRQIGRVAAELINPEDILIIDSGSTTEWLAKSLPADFCLYVLCYALNILIEVHRKEQFRVSFAGGDLHRNTLMCASPEGLDLIRRFRAGKAFLSAGGFHPELGITTTNAYEIEAKRAVIRSSATRILLMDSSKFGRVSPGFFADPAEIETIITDSGIDDDYREFISEAGIELVIA